MTPSDRARSSPPGAQPRRLPGADRGPGVHYLRTIDDAIALRDDLAIADRVVVIGAGFIGLEVAASARQLRPGGHAS